jgi:hypothetical protein
MQQTRIHIGGEQHAVREGSAQRLHQQQLVVDIGADHADRPDLLAGTAAVGFQLDLFDQAPHIVPLVAAFRPFDGRLLVVLGLVAARHEPHLAGGAVGIGPVQTAQVRIVLQPQMTVPIGLGTRQAVPQRPREASGVDRVPLVQQDDPPARVVGEAAHTEFVHQKLDQRVVGADGADEEGRRTGRHDKRLKPLLEGVSHAVLHGCAFLPACALRAFRQRLQARRRPAQLPEGRGRIGVDQPQPGQRGPILVEELERLH